MSLRINSPQQKIPYLSIKAHNRKAVTARYISRQIKLEEFNSFQGREVILSRNVKTARPKQNRKNYKQGLSKTINIRSPCLSNNFGDSSYRRVNKLGLSDYIKKIISGQNQKLNEENLQLLTQTLNRTWVDCRKIQPRLQKFSTSLKIKSSSQDLSKIKVQWKKQEQKDQLGWDEKQYIPNHQFPCRKNSKLIRNRYFSNKSDKYEENVKIPGKDQKKSVLDFLKRDSIHKLQSRKNSKSQQFEKSKTKKSVYGNKKSILQNISVFSNPPDSDLIKGKKSKLYA